MRIHSHNIKLTVLKQAIQWHLVDSQRCANLCSTPKENPLPSKQSLPAALSPAPGLTEELPISMDLPLLATSYGWSHTICDLWGLASFT